MTPAKEGDEGVAKVLILDEAGDQVQPEVNVLERG